MPPKTPAVLPAWLALLIPLFVLAPGASTTTAQAIGLPRQSDATRECVACHQKENPALYQQWGESKHYRANVGCFECHSAGPDDKDAIRHYDHLIATIVSPNDCARCHAREVAEFRDSHHSKGGRILGSLDNLLAEVVEGNRGLVTEGFPEGVSAAAVSGCWQCHGSRVEVLADGRLDPATWPNTGIGRINPDGSEGACSACHSRHAFSVAQARSPESCGRCHMGPDHPQLEIFEESKHGAAFAVHRDALKLDSPKWIVGEDYSAAPTCATCHMSATRKQDATHDVGLRISWNNRPPVSIRPEVSDAQLGLPGQSIPWQVRRENMQDVCRACHDQTWIDNFYVQYDGLIELYNTKFAAPGLALYELAKPLLGPVEFAHKLDFLWFELWHHEGRRARHGASMMAPDYTHWHGTYELAKNFYSEYVPELRRLGEEHESSDDPALAAAAEALLAKLDEVLRSDDHKWFLGLMDPAEAARRAAAAAEYRQDAGAGK